MYRFIKTFHRFLQAVLCLAGGEAGINLCLELLQEHPGGEQVLNPQVMQVTADAVPLFEEHREVVCLAGPDQVEGECTLTAICHRQLAVRTGERKILFCSLKD